MISEIKSKKEIGILIKDLKEFLKETANNYLGGTCFLIIYKHNEICLALIKENVINIENISELNEDYVIEIRMFSESGELHLWKINNDFRWRVRIDNEGELQHIYEETHYLWGTKISQEDSRILLEEHRGMQLRFPIEIKGLSLPLRYRVRNYFTFDKEGLLKFFDSRLIEFIDSEGGVLNA